MKESYLDAVSLIERLHRHFLEVIKSELERTGIHDVSNIQALILFNIGHEELTVGELTNRGYYLGSNVSYNLKKMVENGYLVQERSPHDRRSVRVRLSEKGLELCKTMDGLFSRQVEALTATGMPRESLTSCNDTLQRLDHFWSQLLQYGIPGSGSASGGQ